MSEPIPKFELTLDGVLISVEASQLTLEQAREMLLAAYPERRIDIFRGLKSAIPEQTKETQNRI